MIRWPLPFIKYAEASDEPPSEAGLRLAISGGRDFHDLAFVWSNLDLYLDAPVVEIGFGCAAGVDDLGWQWAKDKKIPWCRYVADWDTYDTSAGTLRNGVMLEDFQPDLLLVFPGGSGTRNCAKQAKEMGIERVFLSLDPLQEAQRWG